jgi:FkbM family methyltransferase
MRALIFPKAKMDAQIFGGRVRAFIRQLRLRTAPKFPGPYIIASNELGIYCLPRKALHRSACQAVLRGRVWEPETVQFLYDNAEGDIIHGGTFFGDFLPALSRAYEHVWAFEPNSDSFKCAEVTIRLNDLSNVSLRNSGMGAAKGTASMCTERDGLYLGGGSFIVEGPGDTLIESIDSVVPQDRHIGMIHMDVEGYEGPALEGARETIRRCQPIIVLETVPGPIDGYDQKQDLNANHVLMPRGRS